MTELRRLLESSDDSELRRVLQAGLADRPGTHAVERALVGLGAASGVASAAATATATSGAAASSSTLGAGMLAKWLAIGLASGTVVGGGGSLVERSLVGPGAPEGALAARQLGPSGRAAPPQASPTGRTPVVQTPPVAEAVPVAPSTAPRVEHHSPVPPVRTRGPVGAPSAATGTVAGWPAGGLPSEASLPAGSGALGIEVAHIDAARHALARKDAGVAAAELDGYVRERRTGMLDREAELLRIELFELLGQTGRAAALARSYIVRYPRDAHAARLRERYGQ